jgi:hypothetical protein
MVRLRESFLTKNRTSPARGVGRHARTSLPSSRGACLLSVLNGLKVSLGRGTIRPINQHPPQDLHGFLLLAEPAFRQSEIDAERLNILIAVKSALP